MEYLVQIKWQIWDSNFGIRWLNIIHKLKNNYSEAYYILLCVLDYELSNSLSLLHNPVSHFEYNHTWPYNFYRRVCNLQLLLGKLTIYSRYLCYFLNIWSKKICTLKLCNKMLVQRSPGRGVTLARWEIQIWFKMIRHNS